MNDHLSVLLCSLSREMESEMATKLDPGAEVLFDLTFRNLAVFIEL